MRMLLPSDSLSGKTGLLVRKIWLGSRRAWESLGVRTRSVLLVFLTVVAVIGLTFTVADRAIHGMLFPQENGNEEEQQFLDMAAFMLGGSVSVILVIALFVMTITRPVQRLATILQHLDRARHDPGVPGVDPSAILSASLPYRNEIGILAAAVTVFRDTLVNLHLMQRRLQGLQDNALDAIITIDTLGRVIEFNQSAEKLFGYCSDDVQGRSISDLIIPPRFREAHQRGFDHQRASAATVRASVSAWKCRPCGPTAASFWWN